MRKILLVVAALLAVLLPGTPAWAHTALVSSDPAEDATLTRAPTAVTLVFSQRLNPDFTTIVLSDATAQRIPASKPAIDDVNGTITIGQPLGNGAYTVAYRVVSLDGHTVQGAYTFTVADPALPATTAERAAVTPPPDPDGIPTPILIGLAVAGVLLAALAAYFYLTGRRRTAKGKRADRTVHTADR
jgi:copper resistance protein C